MEKKTGFFKAFKNFLLEGDAISMAVGVIIGAAMKDLVTSLVDNMFTPVIGLVLGKVDFSSLSITIGSTSIKYGAFITSLINFVLMAFVVFLIIYLIDKVKEGFKKITKQENCEQISVALSKVRLGAERILSPSIPGQIAIVHLLTL